MSTGENCLLKPKTEQKHDGAFVCPGSCGCNGRFNGPMRTSGICLCDYCSLHLSHNQNTFGSTNYDPNKNPLIRSVYLMPTHKSSSNPVSLARSHIRKHTNYTNTFNPNHPHCCVHIYRRYTTCMNDGSSLTPTPPTPPPQH